MPRTLLTPQTPKGPYPGTVAANALDYTYVAADLANGNEFVGTGRDLLLMKNDDAAPQTITLTSAADPYGRTSNITAYSMGIGEFAMFWFGNLVGWDQGGGKLFIDVSDVDIKLAVVRLP